MNAEDIRDEDPNASIMTALAIALRFLLFPPRGASGKRAKQQQPPCPLLTSVHTSAPPNCARSAPMLEHFNHERQVYESYKSNATSIWIMKDEHSNGNPEG